MEEFKSEDFSVSKEDEDYAPSGGECHEDAVNELVKEGEMGAEEETQKTKGTKRKAESVLARKRKHSGLSPQHEEEEDANRESGGSISEKEDVAAEQEKGAESEDAREEEEEEMLASSIGDVEPKSEVPPSTQVKTGEENKEMASSKVVKTEEQEKPKEPEEVKVTKVFDIAGEKVRFLRRQGRPGMSPEHEPPRSEGGQHATGEEQRSVTNTSSKNESTKRKWKRRANVVVTGEESKLRCCKEEYCIGTWNVRSMNPGKLDVVKQEMERINIDILGISELKWTGMGELNSDDHYIYYCGQQSLRRNGVAIIVNKRVRNAVIGCNLKNDRMISVRFQGKPFNLTVIQVYAPTPYAPEPEVYRFYEDLQHLLEITPKIDVLFIIGDWNAKVGSQEIPRITGKFGLGVQNEAGRRLIEFCYQNRLVIANTLFQQHKRRLYTWTSPDGRYRDQIDYIICRQRWRSSVQSAKTRPGADCGSDHKLLIAKFRLKLKIIPKTTRPFRGTNEVGETSQEAKSVFKQTEKGKPQANVPSNVSSVPGGSGVSKEVGETSQEGKSVFKQNEKEEPESSVPSAVPSLPAGSGVSKEVGETSQEGKSVFKQNEKEEPQSSVPSAVPSLPAGSGPENCDLEKNQDCSN
ncbi:PREDICTED: craniofacial development protein 2-like isoform X1 [Bison bison bison]|uniref:Craniofacial development protein 2-like isoform X1 n=2 Tax=Bovinae TaxID=27592 RepID=A0A6P3I308_BISBB|nr:PREDICTED: craniofacial development protein 2 [Bos mutus]XP_010849053.1 PREDICTED: craniofacial development protein 2-like isoform X1 [Bison bison bison]XP_010849054.1 PREDICTED: craniofacial development protein 2-like isoform X1 [Bison bison bison]XP_010849055.1 PREDICTED: craniofacial development protein 2-like isoform X1 [Bison bison bison]XP_010849056.1 PREDICTED: craniofacial development protein 2-like isoform X1 [Bison bison bison]